MTTPRNFVFFITLLLLSSHALAGQEQGRIHVAVFDWCPYICPESKSHEGILVELVNQVYLSSSVELVMHILPWSRAIDKVNKGELDALLGPAKTEAPELVYPNFPIGFQQQCFFRNRHTQWHYKDENSFNAKTIIHATDAKPDMLTKLSNAHLISMPYQDSADFYPKVTRMIQANRADLFIVPRLSTLHYLAKNGQLEDFVEAGCMTRQKLYLAFSPAPKKQDKYKQFIEILDSKIDGIDIKAFINERLGDYLKPSKKPGF